MSVTLLGMLEKGFPHRLRHILMHIIDVYYVAYKLITLSCISFMFIEIKFIHWHSCVMFAMKSISIYNN